MSAVLDVAHGVGGREDLPLPFSYALAGAAAALVVSFAALGFLWRRRAPLPRRTAAVLDSSAPAWTLRAAGLAAAGLAAVAALMGPDDALNPVPGIVYVLLWVGLVPASLLFGPV